MQINNSLERAESMLGVIIALITAFAWAVSSILLKFLTIKIHYLHLNMLRLWTGSITLAVFLFLTGRDKEILLLLPRSLSLILLSGIVAISIGDTLYIKSLTYISVSLAFPVAQCTFPALTLILAILILGEKFTGLKILGAFLILFGLYLVVVYGSSRIQVKKISIGGISFALIAALSWTFGALALKIGAGGVDPFVVASLRVLVAAIALLVFAIPKSKGRMEHKYQFNIIMLAVASGLLTYCLASVGYITAVQIIGVGKATLLSSVAPIFVIPLSMLFLREKPSLTSVIGLLLCIVGIIMINQ